MPISVMAPLGKPLCRSSLLYYNSKMDISWTFTDREAKTRCAKQLAQWPIKSNTGLISKPCFQVCWTTLVHVSFQYHCTHIFIHYHRICDFKQYSKQNVLRENIRYILCSRWNQFSKILLCLLQAWQMPQIMLQNLDPLVPNSWSYTQNRAHFFNPDRNANNPKHTKLKLNLFRRVRNN